MCVCCGGLCVSTHVYQKKAQTSETVVKGSCELSAMTAEKRTLVLSKSSQELLTAESSLQPPNCIVKKYILNYTIFFTKDQREKSRYRKYLLISESYFDFMLEIFS